MCSVEQPNYKSLLTALLCLHLVVCDTVITGRGGILTVILVPPINRPDYQKIVRILINTAGPTSETHQLCHHMIMLTVLYPLRACLGIVGKILKDVLSARKEQQSYYCVYGHLKATLYGAHYLEKNNFGRLGIIPYYCGEISSYSFNYGETYSYDADAVVCTIRFLAIFRTWIYEYIYVPRRPVHGRYCCEWGKIKIPQSPLNTS